MNVNSLDSSAWIEIFHNGANAENFLPAISNISQVVVSVIALYEVWRYTIQHADRVRAREKLGTGESPPNCRARRPLKRLLGSHLAIAQG